MKKEIKGMRSSRVVMPALMIASAGFIAPCHAEDKSSRDALLEAALKRISALEAKVGRMDSLEEENRKLRRRLGHTEKRLSSSYTGDALRASPVSPVALPVSSVSTAPAVKTASWEGFYGGINAGYGAGNIRTYTNTNTIFKPRAFLEGVENSYDTSYVGGAIAGGQVGYNHVFANHIVIGGEADISWANIYNNVAPTNTASTALELSMPAYRSAGIDSYDVSRTTDFRRVGMDWTGTVRFRLGYDLGGFLPYVTGGLAYGGLTSNISSYTYGVTTSVKANSPLNPVGPPPTYTVRGEATGEYRGGGSHNETVGWTLGAGAEYMVADGWSVKGEYLYSSIGGVTTPIFSQSTEPNDTKALTTENTGSFGVHQVRVGLNYHPGWTIPGSVLPGF